MEALRSARGSASVAELACLPGRKSERRPKPKGTALVNIDHGVTRTRSSSSSLGALAVNIASAGQARYSEQSDVRKKARESTQGSADREASPLLDDHVNRVVPRRNSFVPVWMEEFLFGASASHPGDTTQRIPE